MNIDYQKARSELHRIFTLAEYDIQSNQKPVISSNAQTASNVIFSSKTQSIREALLGCVLAKIIDHSVDITKPYINQGENAFNGRTLDEKVINPFLKEIQVPSSKGPYLATFRRSVKFDESTMGGVRDREAFKAMLCFLKEVNSAKLIGEVELLLRYLLCEFIRLRDQSQITLTRVNRLSLVQLKGLINAMLNSHSGGRYPVLLTTAMFMTMKKRFQLSWDVRQQDINVSDSASGAGGDIDIYDEATGKIILSVEITERTIDKNRVETTFSSKIMVHGIDDYLFLHSSRLPDASAYESAIKYFAQGHDIVFLEVESWLVNCLALVGVKGRCFYVDEVRDLLNRDDIPSSMKVMWNDLIAHV